jgi:ribosome-binding ATPase YchF (GTP1/OBG family)
MKKGSTAVEAAGVIHSDLAQGFIRAEIMGWDDFISFGSHKKAKEAGKLRLEGRDYIMKDGDITLFRFNI